MSDDNTAPSEDDHVTSGFLPLARERRRYNDGSIECIPIQNEGNNDLIDTARLRTVLNMLAEGLSQGEIAEHFARSTRTIRRWITEAKQRRVSALNNLSPHDLVSSTFYRYSRIEADLQVMKREALAEGDRRSAIECVRQIRQTERDKYIVLEKAGFFESFKFIQPEEQKPPGKHSLNIVLKMIEGTFDSNAPTDSDEFMLWVKEDGGNTIEDELEPIF